MRTQGFPLPVAHEGSARPAPRRHRVRHLIETVAALVLTAVLAVAALNPNQPWTKRRLQAFVRSSAGLDIDYRWIHLHPLSGVEVDDLVVRAVPEFRPVTPDLLRASLLGVRWSLSSLSGKGPRLRSIVITDVHLAVVVDQEGRTSLDALLPPSVPLSRTAGDVLASTPLAARIAVERADVELVVTNANRVVEHDWFRGLGLEVTADRAREGWRMHAAAGSSAQPLDVRVAEERADGQPIRQARAAISIDAALTASTFQASLDAGVLESPVPLDGIVGNWHAEAGARFDPAVGVTSVTAGRVTSPAGAAVLEASLDVPDRGPAFVRRARGEVEVPRLLGWIPLGLLPATAERGQIRFEVESTALDSLPRPSEGGLVHVDADLTNVQARASGATLRIARASGAVDVRPTKTAGVSFQGGGQLDAATVESGEARVEIRDLATAFYGERARDGALTATANVAFGRIRHRAGGLVSVARDGQGRARLGGARLGPSAVDGVMVSEIDASASAVLDVVYGGKTVLGGAPAQGRVELRDVLFDARRPRGCTGAGRVRLDVGGDGVVLRAAKHDDAVDYALRAVGPNLGSFRFLLPSSLVDAAEGSAMSYDLRSTGRLERLAGPEPRLRQDTTIDIERPAFGALSARALTLALRSDGNPRRFEAEATARASGLSISGTPPSDDTLDLSASWDKSARSIRLDARAAGRAEAQVNLSAALEGDGRALAYDASTRFSKLAPLGPLLAKIHGAAGVDLSGLEVEIGSRGRLLGVFSGAASDVGVQLEEEPWRTAGIEGSADIRLANVRWARRGVVLDVPAAAWHGGLHSSDAGYALTMHTELSSLRLGLGHNQIDVAGISDDTTALLSGELRNPQVDLDQRAVVRGLEQDFAAEYPPADMTIAMSARREPEGLVRVSNLHAQSSAGTTIDLEGGIDLDTRRSRKLSLVADVTQDLDPLSFFPRRFSGHGRVKVAATVDSPDLAFFATRLKVTAADVRVRIPSAGVEAQSIDAEVPVHMDFDAGGGGVRVRHDGHNRYAMLRFADQHPFLSRSGFVLIGSLKTPQLEIDQFVGNLAVDQNVVSLGQFEMALRGGRLAGSCALDWDGPSSILVAHLRAAGLRSTYGEPLDGSVGVVISAADRSIEGRGEIVRMGKRHLLDVLDIEDPTRVDPTMNRVRSALAFGYPSRIHVAFSGGFARARVELGGLAQFMSIDELRGIPTGPLVDRLVEAVLDGRATP